MSERGLLLRVADSRCAGTNSLMNRRKRRKQRDERANLKLSVMRESLNRE
jgi:hypothetical protein